MPTLIRLLVVLLVLAGLAFGAMVALVATVNPRDKQVTIRIPARDLVPQAQPVGRREIDTSRPATPAAPVDPVPAAPTDTPAVPPPTESGDEGDVVTRQQGVE